MAVYFGGKLQLPAHFPGRSAFYGYREGYRNTDVGFNAVIFSQALVLGAPVEETTYGIMD